MSLHNEMQHKGEITMQKVLHSEVDMFINESKKIIIINPKGERFYNVPCEDMDTVFMDATLSIADDGSYEIFGKQTIYTEHRDSGFNYEKLLCEHPAELIHKRSFLGLFSYYSVRGIMKREVIIRYACAGNSYNISQRMEFLSQTCKVEA